MRDAVRLRGVVLQLDELDGLDVELVAQDVLELGERRGIRHHDREPGQRQAHALALALAQGVGDGRDLAHRIHR